VDAVFTDCSADESTQFFKCCFSGDFDITGTDRKSWSRVPQPVDPKWDVAARLVWEDIREDGQVPADDVARDLMRLGLEKFWHHGRLKKSIARNDWNRGSMGSGAHGKRLLRAMLKVGLLEEIRISGVSEGGLALVSGVGEIQQFMDNGLITGKVRELFDELKRNPSTGLS
jgi:hypothetical protein